MDTIALGPFSAYAYGPTSIGMSCGGGEGEVSPLLNAQAPHRDHGTCPREGHILTIPLTCCQSRKEANIQH